MSKGFTQFSFVMALALMILFIMLTFTFITSNMSSIEDLRAGACERFSFLPICGPQPYDIITAEYLKAKHSVASAACAYNSVISGKEEACVKNLNDNAVKEKYDTRIACDASSGKFICNVNHFTLLQPGADSKFIKGHGDPQFLAYWNAFPPETEESWSSFTPEGLRLTNLIVGYRTVGLLFTMGHTKGRFIPMALRYTLLLNEVRLLFPAAKAVGSLISEDLSSEAKELVGDTTDYVNLIAQYLKSKKDKYTPIGRAILLKSPYRDPEFKESQLSADYPMLFQSTNFYAVSPCTANLKLRNSIAECEIYAYNSDLRAVTCEKPKEVGTISENNECKGSEVGSNRMVFKEGDFIPGRLEELFEPSSREDIAIYEDLGGNEFVITDTATGITFFFEPDPPGQAMKHRLYRISVVIGDRIKIFDINDPDIDGWNYQDTFIRISASATCEWHGDPAGEDAAAPPYQTCVFGDNGVSGGKPYAQLKDERCLPCIHLARHLGSMKEIRFQRLKSILVDEDGKKTIRWMNKLGFWYDEDPGGYYLTYYDANEDGFAETLAVTSVLSDGIRNMEELITKGESGTSELKIPKMMIQFSDVPGLADGKPDHKFETVIIPGCRTRAVFADMEKVRTGKTNFCYPEKTWVSRFYGGVSYAPEIGAVVLGVIYGIRSGSPFGAYPGIKTGFKVGMGAMGLVELGKFLNILPEDPTLWPGDKY